jgi:raffinose/stachyose/melibiose transport system permease protein
VSEVLVATGSAPRPPIRRARKPINRGALLRSALVWLAAILTVGVPLWIIVINSVKPLGEASAVGVDLPTVWQGVENYGIVVNEGELVKGFGNTLLLVIPSVIGVVLLGAMASWVFARSRHHAVSVLYYICISGILIPPAIVVSVLLLKALAVQGTHIGVILFYLGTNLSLGIFLTTGFVKTVPMELEEAARIDGAGPFRVFVQIILPLLTPVLATEAFIVVLGLWNDFLYPFFMLPGSQNRTLTLGLYNFANRDRHELNWNLVFADIVLVSIPMVVVFLVAQRRIVSGLMGTTHK